MVYTGYSVYVTLSILTDNQKKKGILLCLFLPGADGHLVWVMDVGATVATVTLAKAVVVHAVLLRRLLLMSVPDYGEASLDCTACFRHAEKKTQVSTNQ